MSSQESERMMKFMKDSAYTCTEEWLQACEEWVQDNYSNSQITSTFLKDELYGQWLDANLMEMESRCLPPNLSTQRVTTLKGRFGLQVNSLQDIGESSYCQYNKLKKLENENTNVSATDGNQVMQNWQPKPRRCLYLTLTDGCQQIFGMEVLPIPVLSLSLKPGGKVIINGPVECRLGVLLLKPPNINVLGGEVESLVLENTQEKILSRNLNSPHQDIPAAGGQISRSRSCPVPTSVSGPANSSLPTQPAAFFNGFDDDDDIFMDIDETIFLGQTTQDTIQTPRNPNSTTQPV